MNQGLMSPDEFELQLATIAATYRTTAILEAGRNSLDNNCTMQIVYGDKTNPCRPTGIQQI